MREQEENAPGEILHGNFPKTKWVFFFSWRHFQAALHLLFVYNEPLFVSSKHFAKADGN